MESVVSNSVLVIEDDPLVVDLLDELLSSLGYSVTIASTVEDAYSRVNGSSPETICIILDYGIPGMDASQFLARIEECQPRAKVLLSSGYSETFIRKDFPMERVHAFIPKPYEPRRLVEEIRRVFSQEI